MGKIFKYIVYQTVNIINNMIYVGVHQTASLDFDGYIGQDIWMNRPSTVKYPKTHFARAVKKYGFQAFRRTTLAVFDTMEDALKEEARIVNQDFIERPDTYNMVLGGRMNIVPTNALTVYVYDLEGKLVQTFDSLTKAALFIYGKASACANINHAIKTGGICMDKYQISSTLVDSMPNYIKYKGTKWEKQVERFYENKKIAQNAQAKKPVAQLTLDGKLVKVWESLTACKKAGFTNAQRVIEGKSTHCKGFLFKYYKD